MVRSLPRQICLITHKVRGPGDAGDNIEFWADGELSRLKTCSDRIYVPAGDVDHGTRVT
jgi:hypothetical protein